MLTKDHALLGRWLLERCGAAPDPLCRKLFLLGCVEPDWNPLTYLRGSLRHQFLHGHNAENAAKHLARLTQRLTRSGVQTPLQWFRFGTAIHYLADRLTFAHNPCFHGTLREHELYETLLHGVFLEHLSAPEPVDRSPEPFGHAQYLREQRSYQTDCRYILGATLALCRQLSVQWVPEMLPALPGAQRLYGQV